MSGLLASSLKWTGWVFPWVCTEVVGGVVQKFVLTANGFAAKGNLSSYA